MVGGAENSKTDSGLVLAVLLREPSRNPLIVTSVEEKTATPGGSVRKNLPAMWETWVSSLGLEDPLEKEMATHSSILAWEILWREEPGGLQSMGLQRVILDLVTKQQWRPSNPCSWVLLIEKEKNQGGMTGPCMCSPCHDYRSGG